MAKKDNVGASREPVPGRTNFQCDRCGAIAFDQVGPSLFHCFESRGGCGRDAEFPVMLWRLGPDGKPTDVEFASRFAMKIAFEIKMHPNPAERLKVLYF